jgi:hypothetical protein
VPLEVVRVSLFKDPVYEDFGFSVSDGLYERGIFINRIRLEHVLHNNHRQLVRYENERREVQYTFRPKRNYFVK